MFILNCYVYHTLFTVVVFCSVAHNQLFGDRVRFPFRKVGHISNTSINYYTPKVFGVFIFRKNYYYVCKMCVIYRFKHPAVRIFIFTHTHKINGTIKTDFRTHWVERHFEKFLVVARKGKSVMIKYQIPWQKIENKKKEEYWVRLKKKSALNLLSR